MYLETGTEVASPAISKHVSRSQLRLACSEMVHNANIAKQINRTRWMTTVDSEVRLVQTIHFASHSGKYLIIIWAVNINQCTQSSKHMLFAEETNRWCSSGVLGGSPRITD